jgi:hypothetical protein
MTRDAEPVVLELAPLPREQVGPFLLLGLDKDADREQIEAHWARRVIWARKGQTRIALEDVNWAREVINDPERRVRADSASFNLDTADGLLRRWSKRFGVGTAGGEAAVGWQPLDDEKPLGDYAPAAEVPAAAEVRAALAVPDVPADVPAVPHLLHGLVRAPLDPWALDLPVEALSSQLSALSRQPNKDGLRTESFPEDTPHE